MLLEDFTKTVLIESPLDDIKKTTGEDGQSWLDTLTLKKARFNRSSTNPDPETTILKDLISQVPTYDRAECLKVDSIPKRYFLGYFKKGFDGVDKRVQEYFHIGLDTRGDLDNLATPYIWIGEKYQSPEFYKIFNEFYSIIFPNDTQIVDGYTEFTNSPPVRTGITTDNLIRWVGADLNQIGGPEQGGWYQVSQSGYLNIIDKSSLTYKKLMEFSGFDSDGKRTLKFLLDHKLKNQKRNRQEIIIQQSEKLKHMSTAKVPGFKNSDGKQIEFVYFIKTTPQIAKGKTEDDIESGGKVIDAYWTDEQGRPIDKGSEEHKMLMAIRGKEPDGKTPLNASEKTKWQKIWDNGLFKLSSYTNKGLRFRNDPKLNSLGKLFGVVGDIAGSILKKPVQSFFSSLSTKFHDPDGLLYDTSNPESFINQMPKWKENNDFAEMEKFISNLQKDFEDGLPDPKTGNLRNPEKFKTTLKEKYPKKFIYSIYGENIYRLADSIEGFVNVNFKEGDEVFFINSNGKPIKVTIIEMNETETSEIVVQDMLYYKSGTKSIKPQGRGLKPGTSEFDLTKLHTGLKSYRDEFKKAHNFSLLKYLEMIEYNLGYHSGSGPLNVATKNDLAKMKEVYKQLAGRDWTTGKGPIDPETNISLYKKGPGTRHNIINRFGILIVDNKKLQAGSGYNNEEEIYKELQRIKKESETSDAENKNTRVPPNFKVGDTVYFVGGSNTRKQGQFIPGVIAGPRRNQEGKPGTPMTGRLVWLKTEDNKVNGFDIRSSSLFTEKEYKDILTQNLQDEVNAWALANDTNSVNTGNK